MSPTARTVDDEGGIIAFPLPAELGISSTDLTDGKVTARRLDTAEQSYVAVSVDHTKGGFPSGLISTIVKIPSGEVVTTRPGLRLCGGTDSLFMLCDDRDFGGNARGVTPDLGREVWEAQIAPIIDFEGKTFELASPSGYLVLESDGGYAALDLQDGQTRSLPDGTAVCKERKAYERPGGAAPLSALMVVPEYVFFPCGEEPTEQTPAPTKLWQVASGDWTYFRPGSSGAQSTGGDATIPIAVAHGYQMSLYHLPTDALTHADAE